jgi:phosphomethylpyrimidine synthase
MKISQEVRDFAQAQTGATLPEGNVIQLVDVEAEMKAKAAEFKAAGSEIYA